MSEWKIGAAKRRDTRNTRGPNDTTEGSAKKDTKRWCRGKVGVEHRPECRDYGATKNVIRNDGKGQLTNIYQGWKILVCTECGKELAHYYPMGRSKKEPPPWVRG